MFFLDELDDFRLYRRNVLLPIDEKDKRHNALAYLLAPTKESLSAILKSPLLMARYYNSYYTERAVMYYVNQENAIEQFEGIYEESMLYDMKDFSVKVHGYDIYIKDVKDVLKPAWFLTMMRRYKVNPRKITNTAHVRVVNKYKDTTPDTIYVTPKSNFEKDFKTYENYCHFNGLVWLFYQINPQIDPLLCMACALKESGVASLYKYEQPDWKFSYNLMIMCKSMDRYELEHGRTRFILDIIKGQNGRSKLDLTLRDMLDMLGRDLQRDIEPMMFGEAVAISDNMGIIIDDALLNEDKKYNAAFKKMLYDDRIKSAKELKEHYKKIKEEYSDIRYTYNDIGMYNKLNLYVDLSSYNAGFIHNNKLTKVNGMKAYNELIRRLLNDARFTEAGYTKQCIVIPVNEWIKVIGEKESFFSVQKSINPLSSIYYALTTGAVDLNAIFGNRDVLFLGDTSFMKINFSKADKSKAQLFLRSMRNIINNSMVFDAGASVRGSVAASARAIKMDIVDNVEKNRKVKIDDISTDDVDDNATEEDKKKKELVKAADKAAQKSNTTDEALDAIDNDDEESEKVKQLLSDLATSPDDRGSNISGARASRLLKLQNDFLDSEFDGRSVKDIVTTPTDNASEKIKPTSLNVDSVNQEWKDLNFVASLESYDLDADIVRIFNSFYKNKSNPLAVRELTRADTSTSNDLIWTYTCKYEDARGKRYTIKLDIPRFVDDKYMILRGNRKTIPIQLFLMPIIKTGENDVQVVTSYKKIFVRRFGENTGKSNVVTDKLIKALNKGEYKSLTYTVGDNTRVCSKYELPIDYIDLAGSYGVINTPKHTIYLNQNQIREKAKVDESKGLPTAIDKKTKEVVYYKPDPKNPMFFSSWLFGLILEGLAGADREQFMTLFDEASTSVRYCFSRASVLGTEIPLVVVCGLAEGLEPTMKKAGIKYSLSEKRPKIDKTTHDVIKYQDGYLTYELNYVSSLLMNGLKQCPTDMYSITAINSRLMYIEFLDSFGGRIKADGLDNFQDCMIDPIAEETLIHYNLPTDYVSVLLHCNQMLADNKFVKHGDVRSTRRARRIEQVAAVTYDVLSRSYGTYSSGIKHGTEVGFVVRQNAVIDAILTGNTTEDQSILNPLLEYEAYYAMTAKGPSGLNSDRAYNLDKRSFDESMTNVMSASTGFAANVGVNRQATIDANITGSRGYIYNDPGKIDEVNSVKSLCMTESLIPWCSTRDDPMRLAMGFTQTMKHGMRCDNADPLLISSGADEALPYLISNTFAHKARGNGKIVEVVDGSHMVIEYDKPCVPSAKGLTKFEYINLKEEAMKNSSSGFFIALKLDTDLKEGNRVKEGQVVAYDKQSFTGDVGATDNLAYKIGTLTKIAILTTDEGYEDSGIISYDLSEKLASDIVYEKEIVVPKDANVFNLVEKGQEVDEGQSLMIMQNAYDDEDVTAILKHLSDDEEGVTELGRIPIKSKVPGVVQDIIIERTVDVSELSPTLKKYVNKFEKEVNAKKAVMKKYGIEDSNKILPEAGILPATGRLKKASDSVVFRIYVKTHEKFAIGCKLIYGTALKGVAKDIFPEGEEPYSEYRKDEKIHSFLACGSVDKRMVGSAAPTCGINKVMVELSRKVKEMAGIPYDVNL